MTFATHLSRKNWLTLSLALGLLGLCFAVWRVGAREQIQPLLKRLTQQTQPKHSALQKERAGQAEALANILNADGTVKAGLSGSFDASGYRMERTATGAPRFVPTLSGPDDRWDSQFSLPGVVGIVYAIAVSGNDLYVGGTFEVAGNNFANKIAKWDGSSWSALGSGVNGGVSALAIISGNLYVGGNFTTAGGNPANNIAKWNGSSWATLGSGVNGSVHSLAVIGNDLYVGGDFTEAGGNPANSVAKWNGSSWAALSSGVGGVSPLSVGAFAVSGSDLYASGNFTTEVGNPPIRIAKWDGSSWIPLGYLPLNNGINYFVGALAVRGGDLYANINSQGSSRIWKWNGSSWSVFTSGLSPVHFGVSALAFIGSDLYAGGSFEISGGNPRVTNIAKWNGNSWSPLGGLASVEVRALAVSGGDLYVGGYLYSAGDKRTNGIAKWDGTSWSILGSGNGIPYYGYVDAFVVNGSNLYVGGATGNGTVAKWNGNSWSALGNSSDGEVSALAVSGGNLYAGGDFALIGDTLANSIAKWNGASWSALGSGLTSSSGLNDQVFELLVSGNDLYVGGSFSQAGGNPANGIAKWNGSSWSALSSGVDRFPRGSGAVSALAVIGGELYVGGRFALAGGNPANNIAKWNGSIWAPLDSGVTKPNGIFDLAAINALAAIGNDLYVGGGFTTAGGNPANNIAKWNGSSWVSLGSGINGAVFSLAVGGNELYVGGSFSQAGGNPANNIAKWDGSNWAPLGSGVDGEVRALAVIDNALYVGGTFIKAGNKPSFYIGRYFISNVSPTLVTSVGVTRQQGSPASTLQIATVNDLKDTANTLAVTVNGATLATINSVTISNISVDATGKVTANIIASATATNATFTLRVTDSSGAFAEAPLTVTVIPVTVTLGDPLNCTGPGNAVAVAVITGNPGNVPVTINLTTSFTNLVGVPGSCNLPNCTVTSAGLSLNTTLAPGQTVTLNYLTRVADGAAPGAQVCTNNTLVFNGGAPLNVTACNTVNCPAAGPGSLAATTSPMSDQKPGSVLLYNVYTSSATTPNAQNTRLSLTNTHPALKSFVHLFFVDGATCNVADNYICLTPNQTASFLTSDLDPGTSGYVVAIAVDAQGCPANFNHLIGDVFVKFSSGHAANLAAEAVTAIAGGLPFCDGNASATELRFDGLSYNVLPHVLAADNIGSRADGNEALLILNRLGGNLGTGAATLTNVFGILYDDAEQPISFGFSPGTCQFRSVISGNTLRTTPRFETFIQAGRSGWFKVWPSGLAGMTGALINFNPNAASNAGAYNQGHNLHKLTTTSTMIYTIPVFPPSC